MLKRTYFNDICFHQTDSSPGIMHSTQTNKFNVKMSAIRCIPVFSHMAYVNQFLALPNAMYSHSIFVPNVRREYREMYWRGKAGKEIRRR